MKLWFFVSDWRGVKRLCLVLWLLLGWSWTGRAEQLKLDSLQAGGRTYSNVTILGFNSTDAYFTHAGGIANVKLRYLDTKLQKRFNYDPAAAAEAENQQAAADARYSAAVGVTSIPYVLLVDPKGVVRYQGHPAAITEKYLESMFANAAE